MERSVPIKTKAGIINKRDGIFLDKVESDGYSMTFTGEINGTPLEDFPFSLTFHSVLACFSCELDTYENMGDSSFYASSDFDLIEDSAWLSSLPVRKDYDKGRYHHYRLSTYDMIYNIIATGYNMKVEMKSEDRSARTHQGDMFSADTNEKRAEKLLKKYGFDFKAISKDEICSLIRQEIDNFQEGSSEYIRTLCGYLYCIGDMTDVPLIEKVKYGINMDVGSMIDGEWIESLKNGGQETESIRSREDIIKAFVDYYEDFEADDDIG